MNCICLSVAVALLFLGVYSLLPHLTAFLEDSLSLSILALLLIKITVAGKSDEITNSLGLKTPVRGLEAILGL